MASGGPLAPCRRPATRRVPANPAGAGGRPGGPAARNTAQDASQGAGEPGDSEDSIEWASRTGQGHLPVKIWENFLRRCSQLFSLKYCLLSSSLSLPPSLPSTPHSLPPSLILILTLHLSHHL